MNNIERFFKETGNLEQFAKSYFRYLFDLLNQLDTKSIVAFAEELETARRNQNTIFIAGNGGSAATAFHIANDIGVDILKKCGIPPAFRILALTENVSVMTAISNDDGYQNLFVNQLKIHYRQGDRLIVISASGNSPNLIEAAEWIKARGGKVIGLLGFDGGKLKDICDLLIHVKAPKGEYGPVEDIHLILGHMISSYLIHSNLERNKNK